MIVFMIVYLIVDLLMIRLANKGFNAGAKTYCIIAGMDIVNIFLIALMFSHQIIITV